MGLLLFWGITIWTIITLGEGEKCWWAWAPRTGRQMHCVFRPIWCRGFVDRRGYEASAVAQGWGGRAARARGAHLEAGVARVVPPAPLALLKVGASAHKHLGGGAQGGGGRGEGGAARLPPRAPRGGGATRAVAPAAQEMQGGAGAKRARRAFVTRPRNGCSVGPAAARGWWSGVPRWGRARRARRRRARRARPPYPRCARAAPMLRAPMRRPCAAPCRTRHEHDGVLGDGVAPGRGAFGLRLVQGVGHLDGLAGGRGGGGREGAWEAGAARGARAPAAGARARGRPAP